MAEIQAHINRHASKYAALAMATAAVAAPFEGYKPIASHNWFDPKGVIDIGYGSTNGDLPGLKVGDHITKEEARKVMADKLARKYIPPLTVCILDFEKMPLSRQVAFADTAYNTGYAGVCRSSMARKINAGDVQGACEAFKDYKIGVRQPNGTIKVYPGLVRRRKNARALCLQED